ncbi:unnamed protein product [Toxocara canis]|uniref:Uncharacterized protein n=1 Tax=Toxocara canis TaxID=6265 RepID=A0A183V1I0_TOXCA|nr:unnamed protein product [Toxocara canis]
MFLTRVVRAKQLCSGLTEFSVPTNHGCMEESRPFESIKDADMLTEWLLKEVKAAPQKHSKGLTSLVKPNQSLFHVSPMRAKLFLEESWQFTSASGALRNAWDWLHSTAALAGNISSS